MHDPSQPKVGVGVLLTDNHGRVLLTLRKRPPEAGCWSIVGGKVDFLETLEQCAIREAREEVGVEISLRSLLCVTDHCLPGENQHWVSPAYLGQILSGDATNCEPAKTREVRWFSINELPSNLTMTQAPQERCLSRVGGPERKERNCKMTPALFIVPRQATQIVIPTLRTRSSAA